MAASATGMTGTVAGITGTEFGSAEEARAKSASGTGVVVGDSTVVDCASAVAVFGVDEMSDCGRRSVIRSDVRGEDIGSIDGNPRLVGSTDRRGQS
jgi:hypothetical protein